MLLGWRHKMANACRGGRSEDECSSYVQTCQFGQDTWLRRDWCGDVVHSKGTSSMQYVAGTTSIDLDNLHHPPIFKKQTFINRQPY
jgi:hypothetical protein